MICFLTHEQNGQSSNPNASYASSEQHAFVVETWYGEAVPVAFS